MIFTGTFTRAKYSGPRGYFTGILLLGCNIRVTSVMFVILCAYQTDDKYFR